MRFEEVLPKIKQGRVARRSGWNGKGMSVFLVPGSEFVTNREPLLSVLGPDRTVTYRPHIDLVAADGSVGVWQPSMSDVLANDWEIMQ